MDLKEILKAIKLNESIISMILGAGIVLILGLLIFNYFRSNNKVTITKEEPKQETSSTSTEEELPAPTLGSVHKVEKGEHLWGIAEKYYKSGYNWVDLAKENNLSNANLIEVGQELKIPQVEAKLSTVDTRLPGGTSLLPDTTDQTKSIGEPIQGNTYTVAKGDHLWGIAIRAYGDGYKWASIARENRLTNPNLIHSGNVFTLPR